MKSFLAAPALLLLATSNHVQAENRKDWHSLNKSNQCARQGSPADLMRSLNSKGYPYTISDKFRAGIVMVEWQNQSGKHGLFFYPTKALCKEIETIFSPAIDPKYE